MGVRKSTTEIPIQLLISVAIILSMTLLSILLVSYSYQANRSALLAATRDSAQQLTANLDLEVKRLIEPVDSTLKMLTFDPLLEANTLTERKRRLPVLANVLDNHPFVSAVYAGYPDGSFLLLRPLRRPDTQQRFDAPKQARYLLQSIETDANGQPHGSWEFYDAHLRSLERLNKPNYKFDPRQRPWYQSAEKQTGSILTPPYIFFTTHEVGVTMAQRSKASGAVVGLDASVNDLSQVLSRLRLTPHTEAAIINASQHLIAYQDVKRIILPSVDGQPRLATLSDLQVPALDKLSKLHPQDDTPVNYKTDDQRWFGIRLRLGSFFGTDVHVLIALPADEMLADAKQHSVEQAGWALGLTLILILCGWFVGKRIGHPIRQLSTQIRSLAAFDFSHPVGVRTAIREVNELSDVLSSMANTIYHFQQTSRTLAREPDLDKLLHQVTQHLRDSTGAIGAVVYLYDREQRLLRLTSHSDLHALPEQLQCRNSSPKAMKEALGDALAPSGQPVITTQLLDREGKALGIMALQLASAETVSESAYQRFVDELSGSLSTAIETRRLIEAQQTLIDGIIRLLADAIDAKSPYTSGHCERVPQLAEILLDAAEAEQSGPFKHFRLSEQQRYEFRIAAWLHDCGKITVPEHVIDKATKLETIYNRIHEIRTRFEVLWRDAEIECLQSIIDGQQSDTAKARLAQVHRQLTDEFAFVAEANIGSERMDEGTLERLKQIARRTWQRHFSDRLGLSQDELYRLQDQPESDLPTTEQLLSDKPEHIIGWGERRPPVAQQDPANRWGFDMELPTHSFNHGELYNLSVTRGTLTEEERFHINDHIVQTICMLSSLPLPDSLKRVPDIAGNHHEKIDGTGYPRRLTGSQLSIPEKIMAIADIFEALTASDRPYKRPNTVSESLTILANMARNNHIDIDLFALFLRSGAYRAYAEGFLDEIQLDPVDIDALLQTAGCGETES